jgi:hypothetical protein
MTFQIFIPNWRLLTTSAGFVTLAIVTPVARVIELGISKVRPMHDLAAVEAGLL